MIGQTEVGDMGEEDGLRGQFGNVNDDEEEVVSDDDLNNNTHESSGDQKLSYH